MARAAVFVAEAASARLSLVWCWSLAGGVCLARCPGPAVPRGGGAAAAAAPAPAAGTSPAPPGPLLPLPALGAQLHRSSRVTAIFNSQANKISIVKAPTYPAFPRQKY